MGILNVGVTGINAAQMGILTTGHNISNASTTGYSRQQIQQVANTPMFTGSGYIGQGTAVSTVTRIYNDYLTNQVLGSETTQAELAAYSAEISQIDNLLADSDAGLSPALQSFFNTVAEASANPSSIPARQALLSGAQALVSRFQSLNQRISDVRSGISTQITTKIGEINSYVSQLAEVNNRILIAQSAGSNQPANDLLDQRDTLITELNKLIRVTKNVESDGSYSVFFGSGQPLVVGASTYKLVAIPQQEDLSQTEVGISTGDSGFVRIPETLINGGSLGGLLQFRSQVLDEAQNNLGRIATVFAANFNAQHKLGQDLTGALGGTFFNTSNTDQLILANPDNAGNGAINVAFNSYSDLTASDYRLTYSGLNLFTLKRLSDNVTWTGTGNSQVSALADLANKIGEGGDPQGFSLGISYGAMQVNDSFLVRPTLYGARDISVAMSDARNIALAAPIRTAAATTNAGTAKISEGAVSSTNALLAAPFSIRYELSSNSFVGFPTGATVEVAGQKYKVTSPTMRIPYTSGANISLDGTGVVISGTPADGDTFVIGAPPTASAVNGALSSLFGATPTVTGTRGASRGIIALSVPLTLNGANNQFQVSVDGAAATNITLTQGTYTSMTQLVAVIQSAMGAGVTVSTDASNRLIVTSTTTGIPPASDVTLTEGNTGLATLFGVPVLGNRGFATHGAALSNPVVITKDSNDVFSADVDGLGAIEAIVPAGSYTPDTFATQLQTSLNDALYPNASVAVSLDASRHLVITSNLLGAASAVSLVEMFDALPAATSNHGSAIGNVALPASPATLALAAPNNAFNINVDGAGNTLITVPAGAYTASQLVSTLQGLIGSSVTVSTDTSNQLVVTSTAAGGSVALTTDGNGGLAAMFGVVSAGLSGQYTGGLVLSDPVKIVAGINDKFSISLNGAAAVNATVPAGSYTPTALASQLQTALNAAVAAPGITVSVNSMNQLVVSSNTLGGASAVSLADAFNTGTGAIKTGTVTSTNSLPATQVTLTYNRADTSASLPARLTGFPVGSVVTVTPINGAATDYTINLSTDYVPYTDGASLAFNGINFDISGVPIDGDTFSVGPNPTGVADNRNANLLGKLQTQNTIDGKTASYQSSYSQVVSMVGNKAREVEVTLAAQDTLVKQGQDAIQSTSGVNLDEEAGNLLRYQQAYQASAKMIEVASKLFDQLLTLGR